MEKSPGARQHRRRSSRSKNGSFSGDILEAVAQDAPKLPLRRHQSARSSNSRDYDYGSMLDSPNTSSTRSSAAEGLLTQIIPTKIFSARNEIQQLATMLSGSGIDDDMDDDINGEELLRNSTGTKSPRESKAKKPHRRNRSNDDANLSRYLKERSSSTGVGGGRPRATSHDMDRKSSNGSGNRSRSKPEEGKDSSSRKSRKGKLSRTVSESYRGNRTQTGSSLFAPQARIREDHAEDHNSPSYKNARKNSSNSDDKSRKYQSLDDTNIQQKQYQQQQQQHGPPRRTRIRRDRTTSDIRGFFPAKVQKYTVLPTDLEEANQDESWVQQQPPELASLLQRPTRHYHLKQMEVERYMSSIRGEIQSARRCNDVPFAILFYAHFAVIAWLSSNYGLSSILLNANFESDISNVKVDYQNLIIVTCFCGLFASGLSGMALLFMTLFPGKLMQIALILSVTMSFIWGTFGIGFFFQKLCTCHWYSCIDAYRRIYICSMG